MDDSRRYQAKKRPQGSNGRFGGGFFRCPNRLTDGGLTATEIAVYCVLARHADRRGKCFPSVRRIAGCIRAGKSTVLKALERLRQAGLVEWSARKSPNGDRTSHLYQVRFITPRGGPDQVQGVPVEVHGCTSSGTEQDSHEEDQLKERRTPPPDPLLEYFGEGFRRQAGHLPTFGKKQVQKWAAIRATHKEELIKAKITAWWTYPLPKNFTGNRIFGAFLQWFDSIPVNGSKHKPTGVARSQDDWLTEMRSGTQAGVQRYHELTNGITDPEAIIQTLKQYGGVNDDKDACTIINACDPARRTTGTDGAGSDLL